MTKISSEGFKLRRVAAGAMLAVTAVAMVGCDLSTGDVSSSGLNQFVRIRNPIGHVQGVVVDSNNRPIQGATVRIGGRATTTSPGGTYEFRDLEVTNTYTGDDPACDSDCISKFLIVVTPPAVTAAQTMQYLGAIVSVTPAQAQFQSFGSEFSGSGNEALDATGTQTFFIDGFRAQAKTAVLPEIGASIEVIGVRSTTTGQALNGVQATLDFVGISATEDSDEGFNSECNNGCAVQYPTVTWSAQVSNGLLTLANLAANSDYNLHLNRHVCLEADNDDSNNAESADTCRVSTQNETQVVTYDNIDALPIEDSGDDIHPFITHVTGVYATDDAMDDTECSNAVDDDGDIGILTRNVNGTTGINFQINEALDGSFEDDGNSVAVWDASNEAYVDVTSVTINGSTVTVTTSDAIEEGVEFDVYFFRTDFPDLAGNVIEVNSDSVSYDCDGNANNWTGYIAVSLHTFSQPSTSVDVAMPVQEIEDPVDNDEDNDFPDSQAISVSLLDVNDNEDNSIQQLNARENTGGVFSNDNLPLLARIIARGESSTPPPDLQDQVEADVARIEWMHVDGARGYVISVPEEDDTEEEILDNFDNDYFIAGSLGGGDLTIGTVDRGGTELLFAINENREHLDVMCVAAVDDLGHPGEPGCTPVLDLIEPTVTIQRSYQHVHEWDDIVIAGETLSVEDDADGENISGCWNRLSGFGAPGQADNAGVVLGTGTDEFGDGGELVQEGSDQPVGSICIGIAPELLMDADVDDADYDPHGAHDELVTNRSADYTGDTVADPLTPDNDNASDDEYKNAYDAAAWGLWARPSVIMGAAVTENLAAVGTPTLTGVTAGLTVVGFQNNVVSSHLDEGNFFIEDLVTFQVNDPYVLANTDHMGTIDFAGAITDEAGITATTDANAVLVVRDMWPPYIVSGQRNTDGTITLVFDSDIYFEDDDGDHITLIDRNGETQIDLEVDDEGNPENFDYDDGGGTGPFTLTFQSEGLPAEPGYDDRFADDTLSYPSATPVQYVIVDFREITDKQGNKWENHDFEVVDDEGPRFLLPDALDDFDVNSAETATDPDGAFTITFTADHPFCNAISGDTTKTLDSGIDPADCNDTDGPGPMITIADADLWVPSDGGTAPTFSDDFVPECNEAADGSVLCDFDTVDAYAIYTPDVGNLNPCDYDPTIGNGDASLSLDATHTVLTFTFTCDTGATTEVVADDEFDFFYDDNAYSAYDGNDVLADDTVTLD